MQNQPHPVMYSQAVVYVAHAMCQPQHALASWTFLFLHHHICEALCALEKKNACNSVRICRGREAAAAGFGVSREPAAEAWSSGIAAHVHREEVMQDSEVSSRNLLQHHQCLSCCPRYPLIQHKVYETRHRVPHILIPSPGDPGWGQAGPRRCEECIGVTARFVSLHTMLTVIW